MSRTPTIMTTATGIGTLPDLLETMAGPRAVEAAFRRARLPLALIENTQLKIPLTSMVALFEHAATLSGDHLFGLHCGLQMAPSNYGLWADYSAAADTLEQGIHRLIQTLPVHQRGARMSLALIGDHAIWSYHTPHWLADSGRQHSDHVLPVMINFARIYLGVGWAPEWINTRSNGGKFVQELSDTLATDWRPGGTSLSIAIDPTQLCTTRSEQAPAIARRLTSVDVFAQAGARDARKPSTVIADIVAMALLEGKSDIDWVASSAGMSVRSLQRDLDASGESFRRIVDRVRLHKANALLKQTDTPITEIAYSLGYSDPANFTRAFRRWTGKSPRAMRAAL